MLHACLQMAVVELLKALPAHLIACLLAQQPLPEGALLSFALCWSYSSPAAWHSLVSNFQLELTQLQ